MPPQNIKIDPLYHDRNLAQFYDVINLWDSDQDYCSALAKDAGSVLDIGCGTGVFLTALPNELTTVGVDPAGAMLEIARNRPNCHQVKWIEGDTRTFRLDQKFDLIVLTGHAFQCFLSEVDQLATLKTIASHLSPTGRFIFDMRNPAREAWKDWMDDTSKETIHHPELGATQTWSNVSREASTAIVTYDTHYQVVETGQLFSASSDITFTPQDVLNNRIIQSGLMVDQWLGDWQGEAFTEQSKEIIPIGRLARN